jgi:uncharacterized protein YdeI (YjbR/CyaY-like superfamily)
MDSDDRPSFFETPDALRDWLVEYHDTEDVLWVGFWKKATGCPSITWPELVDELLCFGWIDGLRKSIDDERWMIRITPRRPRSNWSEVNQRRFAALSEEGRVALRGLEAHRRWEDSAAGRGVAADDAEIAGAGESRSSEDFGPELENRFQARLAAWEFFQEQSPGYRKTATRWVMSAKREETRLRRLETLIEDSADGVWIKELRRQDP